MKKFKEKILNLINDDWVKFASGILICLIAIFGALSHAPSNDYFIYVSKFMTWCLSFLFGSILTYGIYFLLFLIGLSVAFSTKKVKITLDMTIFGVSFLILGCLILIANAQTMQGETYLTFSNFGEVFNNQLIQGFPEVTTFKNSGVIGMFLVALINSGMTYIGSNVIGSLLLVAGIFFTFAKPAIKFSRVIINYYFQQFGKKKLQSDDSYNLAKDVNYDTTAINAIKANNEIKKQEEKVVISKFDESTNKVEENESVKNEQVNSSPTMFKTKKFYDLNNQGLTKAKFSLNEEIESQETCSEPVAPKVSFNSETKEVFVEQNNYEKEAPRQETYSGAKISDMFAIPRKKEEVVKVEVETKNEAIFEQQVVEDEIIPTTSQNEAAIEIIRPEPISQDTFSAPKFEEAQEEVRVQQFDRKRIDELANTKPQLVNTEPEYSNKIEIKKKAKHPYSYPNTNLLEIRDQTKGMDENIAVAEARKEKINEIFNDLGVGAQIVGYTIGPSVTQYDLQTDKNVSISGLNKYINDISVRLGGLDTRFIPIVSGKSTSGLEIANAKSSLVNFKDCVEQLEEDNANKLTIPFGLDITGKLIAGDLREFPHLLVCGTTGSGKSIFIHSVLMSLIMRNSPEDLRLIMIDPKRVEFSKYKDIAHLLCPPISESQKAFVALNKLVDVMEARYSLFEDVGVSNIKQYNQEALESGKDKLPYIVLICDEFADLMDTNRKCSEPIVRIGQKARAAGIHMIIATQRPSVNVITGTIKANLPVRVALMTSSATDSVTILNEGGAEKLLGNGDMLIMCPLFSKQGFTRVQGSFVDNKEIKRVCDFIKDNEEVEYDALFMDLEERSKVPIDSEDQATKMAKAFDEKYEEVKKWVVNEEFTSISKIQRTFGFGFPRAGKIFNQLEEEGIIAKENEPNNAKGRKVLVHHICVTEQSENPGSSEQSTMDYTKREGGYL